MTTELEPTADELRAAARKSRRAFASSPLSPFVSRMQEVIRDYLKARAEGVSREDAVRGIEEVVREVWPARKSQFQPACSACEDIGWRLKECVHGMRCARYRCGIAESSWWHEYVVPCDCEKGDKFRRSGLERPKSVEDLAAAGKTKKKPRGFSRFGD